MFWAAHVHAQVRQQLGLMFRDRGDELRHSLLQVNLNGRHDHWLAGRDELGDIVEGHTP